MQPSPIQKKSPLIPCKNCLKLETRFHRKQVCLPIFIHFLIVKENLWETLTSCKPINMDASYNSFNFQTPAHRKFPKVEST